MPTAAQMIDALKDALELGAGTVEVTIDGQRTRYDRKQALEELAQWERRAARERGRRPIISTIDLSGF